MERFDEILMAVCEENACAWWDVVDGDLMDEVTARATAVIGHDADADPDFIRWVNQMVADL